MIRLEIPIIPVAKARAKRGQYGQAYIPKKTKGFEQSVRWAWQKSRFEKMPDAPLSVRMYFFMPKPKKPKYPEPAVKPDIDNLIKSVSDALNGFAWSDDSLITKATAEKIYATTQPMLVIEIDTAQNNFKEAIA